MVDSLWRLDGFYTHYIVSKTEIPITDTLNSETLVIDKLLPEKEKASRYARKAFELHYCLCQIPSSVLAEESEDRLWPVVGLGQSGRCCLLQDLKSYRLTLFLGKVSIHNSTCGRTVSTDRL